MNRVNCYKPIQVQSAQKLVSKYMLILEHMKWWKLKKVIFYLLLSALGHNAVNTELFIIIITHIKRG
jgi:hypothetical protein